MPPERILGIDPGSARVGLAVSDPLGVTAQGLETYRRGRGSFLEHLAGLVEAYEVGRIVVGYPLHMNGSEGESALAARRLSERLRERFGLPVLLWDERLTTAAARKAFPPGSRKDWDRISAVLILQSYLDSQAGEEA